MSLIDFLVLTPLDQEGNTARKVLCPIGKIINRKPIDAITYYLWKEPVDQQPTFGEYLIVAASMGRRTQGQAYAGVFASHCVNTWKPNWVVLLGIAGSLEPERLRLGDVVVSDVIFGYEVGDAEGKKIRFRPTFHQTAALGIDRVRAFRNDPLDYESWQDECANAAAATGIKDLTTKPELHIEVTASGNYVVKSVSFGRKLRKEINAKISAVEMEAEGLHQAIYLNTHRTDALMIRGISDYADKNKSRLERESNEAWRVFASANAARLLKAILKRVPVSPLSEPYSLDLTLGSYLQFRRKDIPSIEYKHSGAQDNFFPSLLQRNSPTPKLSLKVIVKGESNKHITEFRGLCVVESPERQIIPGEITREGMLFLLPASEWGLRVQMLLSFPVFINEISVVCNDDFQRSCEAKFTRPVQKEGMYEL
jgi:nucleoside phosphorylase